MSKTTLLSVVLLLAIATNVLGNDKTTGAPPDEKRDRTYVFIAPGGVEDQSSVHVGIGGETTIYKALNLGAELGAVRFDGGAAAILSAGITYQFLNASRSGNVVPFATFGASLAAPGGPFPGVNFGGGTNYWFHDRMGVRFEFRDHAFQGGQLYEARVAFTFRDKR